MKKTKMSARKKGAMARARRSKKQEMSGRVPVLLVPQALRPILSRFTRQTIPALRVLAYNEIPESRRVRIAGAVGA